MKYIKVSVAAERWGISPRRVRILCAEGKVDGVIRRGKLYMIPENAEKPADGRRTKPTLFQVIDQKMQQRFMLRPLTLGETERMRDDFMTEFTYDSDAIGGNTLSLKETAVVLRGLTVKQKPLKEHMEAVAHRDAFLYVQDVAEKELPLDEAIIRNIHSLLMVDRPEDKGMFRRIPVRITGTYDDAPPPHLIPAKLEELLTANEDRMDWMHPLKRIALFHLEFEALHPFLDGNGRTGRLLINLDLICNGYPPISIRFTDRERYYAAFDSFFNDGSYAEMTDLIAERVNESLDNYLKILSF